MEFVETLRELFPGDTGIAKFIAILEINDIVFDEMYATMKNELVNNILNTKEFKDGIRRGVIENNENVQSSINGLRDIIELVNTESDLSDNKKELLLIMFESILGVYSDLFDNPRFQVEIPIELCHPKAMLPTYAHKGDAGMDVYAVEQTIIKPQETVIIKTGIKIAVPIGYELQVRPRSGISAKTKLRIANAPGTIDNGYLDEIGIIITNMSLADQEIIKEGDKIAQLVLQASPMAYFYIVESVENLAENRGGGFGSTDSIEEFRTEISEEELESTEEESNGDS